MSGEDGCEHDGWQLREVVVSTRGADQVSVCPQCGATGYEAGRSAVRDTRPPLD